jgi:hypothetical protein
LGLDTRVWQVIAGTKDVFIMHLQPHARCLLRVCTRVLRDV